MDADALYSFQCLTSFLKSNVEMDFEIRGCVVKKIHSTKKQGNIRNRERTFLMFYFSLVKNIYNISYMYRAVLQLESEEAERKAHTGSRSFHTVFG